MKFLTKFKYFIVTPVFLFSINHTIANVEDETLSLNKDKGRKIAIEVKNRDKGWGDSSAQIEMTLINRSGQQSERLLSIQSLEIQDDGDKSLAVFKSPKDVEGTAFLSHSHILVPDQQWLFLPSLRRVKRVSSANKSGPFLGSELAFEDLSSFEVERYDYEFLREEQLSEMETFVVKYIPLYEHSGYQYQEVWIDKAEYRVQKIDFYDRKGALLKTLEMKDYKKYLGRYWRASEFVVGNHQTGKSTILKWTDIQFAVGLESDDFKAQRLKRLR